MSFLFRNTTTSYSAVRVAYGPTGPAGERGDDGVSYTGSTGPRGMDGMSYTGPTGERGERGVDGVSYTGPTGERGERGVDGMSYTGPMGERGADGVSYTGPTGERGERGVDGQSFTGPRGEDGVSYTGPTGAPGVSYTGPTGAQGTPGMDGVSYTGPTGPSGVVEVDYSKEIPSSRPGFSVMTTTPCLTTGVLDSLTYQSVATLTLPGPGVWLLSAVVRCSGSGTIQCRYSGLPETEVAMTKSASASSGSCTLPAYSLSLLGGEAADEESFEVSVQALSGSSKINVVGVLLQATRLV